MKWWGGSPPPPLARSPSPKGRNFNLQDTWGCRFGIICTLHSELCTLKKCGDNPAFFETNNHIIWILCNALSHRIPMYHGKIL